LKTHRIELPCWLSVLGLVFFAACGATGAYSPNPGLYDRIPKAWDDSLFDARRYQEEEELDLAHEILVQLTEEEPRILPVRIFLQEVELELLVKRGRAGRLSVPVPDKSLEWLSNHYLTEAEGNPTPESLVLAARLAPDADKALELLDQAEALDLRCVWIPYARAWWNFTNYDFTPAEDAVRQAFRLDSGHLPTMRLQAIVLTAAGETGGAIKALELWWRRTKRDPLISAEVRAEALLDLASLKVLAGKPKEALEYLETADPRAIRNEVRLKEVFSAAHEARDDFIQAHEAVRLAREKAPEDPLPLVQEAMLHARQRNDEAELEAWRAVLAHLEADTEGGFSGLLYRLQALTRLKREEQRQAALAAEASPIP